MRLHVNQDLPSVEYDSYANGVRFELDQRVSKVVRIVLFDPCYESVIVNQVSKLFPCLRYELTGSHGVRIRVTIWTAVEIIC